MHNIARIMASIGLADDKAGTAPCIFRSTGNLKLESEGADTDKVSCWGRCSLQVGENTTRKSSS